MSSKPGPFTHKTAGKAGRLLAVPPCHHRAWARGQEAAPASFSGCTPFLSLLMGVNSFQRLELESENPRYSLWNVCLVYLLTVWCVPLLVCRSQVYPRTVHSVESSTVKRKESQVFPHALPSPHAQPHTAEPSLSDHSAEQPCSEGRFYHCQERQEFLLLSTNLQACWFSVTDFSEIVRVFPDVENLKLCVRWTNRMYSLLLLLCLVTSLRLK